MSQENLMCPAHKAGNSIYRKEYDRIFKKQNYIEDKKMRYCKLCGNKCGEISSGDWEYQWNRICDECASNLDNIESFVGSEEEV